MKLPEVHISIKSARQNANMSQKEFAEAIGVDKSTVYNWESGNTEPNATQLRKISELSHIPMDFIFVP